MQVRRADCLEVTGIDFVSSIRLGQTSTATLCTENEEELATTSVFENFLRVFSAYHVLGEGGLVLHSAGLVVDNRAYVFIGRSGAGKTTLTRKAQEYGAKVLSDDLNVVLPTPLGGDGYVGCAVPFAGEFGRILDQELERHYPLAGIVLLEQGDDLNAKPVGKASALASILAGCPFVNQDDNELDRLFDTIGRLLHGVPVCRLSSRRDDEVGAIMAAVTAALTVV